MRCLLAEPQALAAVATRARALHPRHEALTLNESDRRCWGDLVATVCPQRRTLRLGQFREHRKGYLWQTAVVPLHCRAVGRRDLRPLA
eukprot:4566470-Prymnesium_polylepis.1